MRGDQRLFGNFPKYSYFLEMPCVPQAGRKVVPYCFFPGLFELMIFYLNSWSAVNHLHNESSWHSIGGLAQRALLTTAVDNELQWMCWFPTEGIKDWAFIVCDMKALFSLSTTFDALDLHCHNFVDQTYWDATPHSRIPAKSVDCKYSLNHHLIHIQGDPTRMSQAIQVQKISKKEDIYDTDGNMAFLRENTNTSIWNPFVKCFSDF